MATKVEGCSRAPELGPPIGERKGRRASLVIQATAAQLADLHLDANRSTALMAELEALLSASQAASGSAASASSAFLSSANFIATQPLEVSSDHDDEEDIVVAENLNDDIDAVLAGLSNRRLKTMRSVSRTASFVSMGGGGVIDQDGSLHVTGTSASFTTRPSFNSSASLQSTVGSPPAGEGRRALSFCNARQSSFIIPRSGPSHSSPLKTVMNNSGPPSAGYCPRSFTNSGSGAAAAGPESSGLSLSVTAERRPTVVAWADSRSPNRRASRTAETPSVSVSAAASAAAGVPSPSANRRSSVCEATVRATALVTSRASLHFSRRASTSYGSFLPHLGRRESETSGGPVLGSGVGSTSMSGGVGGGGAVVSGAAGAASSGGAAAAVSRWGAFIGGARSGKSLKG